MSKKKSSLIKTYRSRKTRRAATKIPFFCKTPPSFYENMKESMLINTYGYVIDLMYKYTENLQRGDTNRMSKKEKFPHKNLSTLENT